MDIRFATMRALPYGRATAGSPEKTPIGIPFNVGVWEGPDGRNVIAALNPLSYGSQVTYDLSKPPPPPPDPDPSLTAQQNQTRSRGQEDWTRRIQTNGDLTGIFADYHYVGTGDVGGSPNESSVRLMEAITSKSKTTLPPLFQFGPPSTTPSGPLVTVGDGPVNVVWSKADQMFRDIANCCATDRLPRYKGDLELINHSAGSLTSEAYQKRWMRKNELLADAAEKASVEIDFAGIRFQLAPADAGKPNAITAHGQTISLPPGKHNRLYLLAAAANGDQKGTFRVGKESVDLTIQDWTGFIGQWDNRVWKVTEEQIAQRPGAPTPPAGSLPPRTRTNIYGEMLGLRPGFIKRADLAWFASHRIATRPTAVPNLMRIRILQDRFAAGRAQCDFAGQ
jgi:hypothetical protein